MKFETVLQSYIINCLSKTNYSSANDGISGNRRSDDIQRVAAETPEKQSIADTEAVPKLPAQNLSLSKRQRESKRMVEYSLINESHMLLTDKKNHMSSFSLKVQASDAKHPRIDREREVAFKVGSFSLSLCWSPNHYLESLSVVNVSVSNLFVEEL